MAVAFLLLGFVLGLLSLAIAEAAALLWAIRALTTRRPSTSPTDSPPPPPPPLGGLKRQGFLWMLEQQKMPKVSVNRPSTQGVKDKKSIVEVFPVKMLAKLEGHSLTLSAPDAAHHTIHLLNCTVVAVSASNLPSRKWAKRYPIKLESKESEICRGSKVCYVYADTSWEKESWCKALRLASTTDKDKHKFHAMLTQEFRGYIASLNAGYPCFLKPSMLSGEEHVVADNTVKTDGSSKVRNFLKRLAKKASTKTSPDSKTDLVPSKQDVGQSSIPSPSLSFNSQLSDSPHTDVEQNLANDGTLCWNLLFSRLFFDAKMNDEVNKAIKARIQRTLSNTRTPAYIGEITLAGLSLGKLPPYLHRMRVVPLDLNELWAFEVDFEYSSGILLHIKTRLEIQEPELEKDIMRTSLKDGSNGDVGSDVLDSIEQYGNRFMSSEALDSVVEDNEADALRKSKSTGWTSTYMSRWKRILHSIADQVSQVPLSLAIKISSIRGTMRVHIKPPPSDRIWYGFTSMPEIEWELESSVGDRKITNSHIASLISNRIKASLRQSLVLPNCESIPVSWMISDTDDWVPRKIAPFIWLNREPPTETSARPPPPAELPGEASAIAKIKSSPPVSLTRSKNESPKKTTLCVDGSEQAEDASTSWQSQLVSASGAPRQSSADQLRMPLLSSSSSSRDDRAMAVAAGTSAREEAGDVKRKRGGRRARVMDLGRRMGGKLEEKGKHIVGKMRENARSNSLLLPDLERATTPPPPPPS
ncbi:unnamed protein product [Urochloa decumbens]|uniref:SMP-LTD domain-containing protein n=2 Tax=Urochloa decumbens TaxID=240449 RepID=A0ABC9E3N7_9POAL